MSDGRGGVDNATITLLQIVPSNDAPNAAAASVTTDEDTAGDD